MSRSLRTGPTAQSPRRTRLRPPPPTAVGLDQLVRLLGAPRAGLVLGHGHVVLLPRLEQGVDDAPRPLHLVAADEQGGVADEGVEQQAFVSVGGLFEEGGY